MITIISDNIDPWLIYIWEQFAKINLLKSEQRFLTYLSHSTKKNKEKDAPIVEYSIKQRYSDSLFIPRKNIFRSDKYTWIDKNLPIFSDTIIKKNGVQTYDIFYNAFVHLSRLEEWFAEKNGNFIRSYALRHPRKDKRVWKQPVVNLLFNELENKIKRKYPQIPFGPKEKPIIEFSHDVDYLYKTAQLRIKKTAFHLYHSFKHLLKKEIVKSLLRISKGANFFIRKSDYWCFDYWKEIEKELGIRSVFYLYSKAPSSGNNRLLQWLIDPSYNIHEDNRLLEKCEELLSDGHKIGMHGSFFSATDEDLFRKEKEILENTIKFKITKTRQHWLNYSEIFTPYIHNKLGIEEDSSVGFNDISAFRAGIASIYNPYDHANEKPFQFKEIPLIIMDSHVHDYADPSFENAYWLFNCEKIIKKFYVSINWHQRVVNTDYHWENSYKNIVNLFLKQIYDYANDVSYETAYKSEHNQ